MKKKIYLYLTGGLGNQLFQYAAAKQIALKNKAQLILDQRSGFIFDFRHNRTFALKYFKLKGVLYSVNLFFFIFRFIKKFFFLKNLFYSVGSIKIIDEFYSFKKFHKLIKNVTFGKYLYILGLFQSEKYFLDNKKEIMSELSLPTPNNKDILKVFSSINKNTVAVCVRSFEDLPNYLNYTVGGIVDYHFYSEALKIILKKIKKPKIFFFSTTNKNIYQLLKNIKTFKNHKIKIITPELGYRCEIETLWLLSQFKNIVISNSTFYWWAAYFATKNCPNTKIISSNQFPNKDSNLKNWTVIKTI